MEPTTRTAKAAPADPLAILAALLTTTLLAAALPSCATAPAASFAPGFDAASGAPAPLTHETFADRPEDFAFAIISDLTGGERPGIFNVAVADMNLLQPAFVMSVGDLIEGYTEDEAEIARQWDAFDDKVDSLAPPFFYVVGNHDISNETMRAAWEERLGRRYYHFVYKDALFIALDSEDYDPALGAAAFENRKLMSETQQAEMAALTPEALAENPAAYREFLGSLAWDATMDGDLSEAQVTYVEQAIAANPDVRWTFLFLHKPLWQGEGNPRFARIEAALADRPYTVFAGHTHNFRHFGTEDFENGRQIHVRLGTTGGLWVHANQEANFDHVMLVAMTPSGPAMINLRLDGMLDETGRIPAGGEELCFSEAACNAKAAASAAQ